MAIQGSLSKLSQSNEDNPYSSFFGGFADRRKKQGAEERQQEKISAANKYAAETSAAVRGNTVKNQSLIQQARRFGPGVLVDEAKTLGKSLVATPAKIAKKAQDQFKYLSGPTRSEKTGISVQELIKAQEKAQALPEDIKIKTKGLGPSFTAEVLGMVHRDTPTPKIREYVNQAVKEKARQDRQTLGIAAEVASYALGSGNLLTAYKAGGRAALGKAVAGTGAAGAVGGAGSALQQEDVTARGVLTGAATGAGLGIVLSGAAAGLGRQRKTPTITRPPTFGDPVIHLPDRGVYARLTPEQQAFLSNEVGNIKTSTKDNVHLSPFGRTGEAQEVTIDEIMKLSPNAKKSLGKIPTNKVNTQIQSIDSAIATATENGNDRLVKVLTKNRDFLEKQLITDSASKSAATAISKPPTASFSSKTKISSAASNTEAKAISEELSKGFKGLPEYSIINLDEQAAKVVDYMNADYEAAKKIAMGKLPAPEGVQASSFYKGVESRAVREGDVALMEQLATESTIPKTASSFGQFNAALAYRDPESPVTAIRSITDARKASNLSIPRVVAKEEADKIVSMAQEVANAKLALAQGGDRYAYGRARIAYDDYVQGLIATANKKNLKDALRHPVDTFTNVAGVSKSLRASLDNSSLLRQGWKTLFTHPGTWAKSAAKSFADFVKTVGGKEAINEVRADIMSRPNSLNGLYKKMGVDVFGITEEAFPSTLPGKIPGAGRFFKASDAAYTGFQQRTRADLADKYLEIAQRSGVDLTSKKELKSIGNLVNSLTSRGHLGRTGERASKILNNVFFSPRLLKSNIDVLTAHQFQRGVTPFVRKQAARNLLQVAVGSAAALKLAQEVTGGKVEWDPRSSNFGKVQIGDTRFDLSGGMASIATLGARIAKMSSKSSTTGEIKPLNSGEFGSQSTLDVIYNFFENKTSPAVSVMRDILKGEDFDGNKPTVGSTIKNLTLPLIINNYQELKDNPRAAAVLPSMIAEGLGLSVNTYGLDSDWNANNGKKITGFKNNVGGVKFKEANERFNDQFNSWYQKVSQQDSFWKLPIDVRENVVTSKKNALTDDILEQYNYKYEKPKKDNTNDSLIEELKKL